MELYGMQLYGVRDLWGLSSMGWRSMGSELYRMGIYGVRAL